MCSGVTEGRLDPTSPPAAVGAAAGLRDRCAQSTALEPEGGHLAAPRLRGGCGGGPATVQVRLPVPPSCRTGG
jgi:hypothetical protein